jgi:hypothetical protein
MKPSKAVCVLLSSTLLLCGCYSYLSVAREEPASTDGTVRFYLNDGSYIESQANKHKRMEGGYQVTGDRVQRWLAPHSIWAKGENGSVEEKVEPFAGVIKDVDIQAITTEKLNVGRLVLGSALTLAAVGYVVVAASTKGGF